MQTKRGEAVKRIFQSSDYETAQEQKRKCIEKYKESASEFVKWVEDSIEEGLTCFSFPQEQRIDFHKISI
jgi:transposase-like protein